MNIIHLEGGDFNPQSPLPGSTPENDVPMTRYIMMVVSIIIENVQQKDSKESTGSKVRPRLNNSNGDNGTPGLHFNTGQDNNKQTPLKVSMVWHLIICRSMM